MARKAKPKRQRPFAMREKKRILAARIDHAIEQSGMTVGEIAWAAGCSDQTVYNIIHEEGVILPQGPTLLGLAMALDVEIDWMLHHVPNRKRARTKTGAKRLSRRNAKSRCR